MPASPRTSCLERYKYTSYSNLKSATAWFEGRSLAYSSAACARYEGMEWTEHDKNLDGGSVLRYSEVLTALRQVIIEDNMISQQCIFSGKLFLNHGKPEVK